MNRAARCLVLLAWFVSPAFAGAYIRLAEGEGRVALEIALRTFEHATAGPPITLAGVAHVADREYYHELQRRLDMHHLVLYEGVGPLWAKLPPDADDRFRAEATRDRLRALRIAIESSERAGRPVETPEDLFRGRASYDARLLRTASVDAWRRPYLQIREGGRLVDLVSLGADGEPGGEGPARDLRLSDLPPLLDAELGQSDGIQARLARAAGLVFQLDAIWYDQPHWRNSDTTGEALAFALAGLDPARARPGDGAPAADGGDALFDTLRGRGFAGRIASVALRLFGASPRSRAMLRLVLIETLARAEGLMDAAGGAPGLERMMTVLLAQRNEIVLNDLRASIEHDRTDPHHGIAVFYGAAHLPEMHDALKQLGYRETRVEWLAAIVVEADGEAFTPEQLAGARGMIAGMLESAARRPAGRD